MAILVSDAAPLSAFARARRLDLLDHLTANDERVTTTAVMEELREGFSAHPELQDVLDLQWLRIEPLGELDVLDLFAEYARRLGSGTHDIGEATVLAGAEAHGAIAFTDDEAAVQVGRDRGVRVVRTLALIARGVKRRLLSEPDASRLLDALLLAGARFPFRPGEFIPWAREHGQVEHDQRAASYRTRTARRCEGEEARVHRQGRRLFYAGGGESGRVRAVRKPRRRSGR